MNSYKIQFKLYVKIFLALALLLVTGGLVFNVVSVIEYFRLSTSKTLSHSLLLMVTVFLDVLIASLLFFNRYIIKDGKLITQFGVIKFKANLTDAINATHFKRTDTLVLYFKNAEYLVIMISPSLYKQFIDEIKKYNPQIYADIDSEEKNI